MPEDLVDLTGADPSEALGPDALATLRERARKLAARADFDVTTDNRLEVVVFELNSEHFAVESRFVREALPVRTLTPLPGVPPFVAGITNLRGEIVPVMDIRTVFGMPKRPASRSYILHLKENRMAFGIIVEAVLGARLLQSDEVLESPATLQGLQARYVRGVASDGLTVLDGHVLLTDEHLIVREG